MFNVARRAVKDAAAQVFHHTGLRRAVSATRRARAGGRRVAIVSYHRVVENFEAERRRSIQGLLISRNTFRRHLEAAHRAGFRFATLSEALEVLWGRKMTARDLMVVTFDDAYRDVFRHAAPVLRAMGVPAILYVPTGYVGTDRRFEHDRMFHLLQLAASRKIPWKGPASAPAAELLRGLAPEASAICAAIDQFISRHAREQMEAALLDLERLLRDVGPLWPTHGDIMSWDELTQWARDGFEVGAHTVHHAVLPLLSEEQIDFQIREGQRELERRLGQPVIDFAYCNGWYSQAAIRALVRHGFRSAVTTEDLPNRIGGDPYTLKRKVLWENFSLGVGGRYSEALTTCQLDDVFGFLRLTRPVSGRHPSARTA